MSNAMSSSSNDNTIRRTLILSCSDELINPTQGFVGKRLTIQSPLSAIGGVEAHTIVADRVMSS